MTIYKDMPCEWCRTRGNAGYGNRKRREGTREGWSYSLHRENRCRRSRRSDRKRPVVVTNGESITVDNQCNKERRTLKILIEAMHGIGDVVCMLPMIKNVREQYREADITVIVNSEAPKEILIHSGIYINNIIVCNMHSDWKTVLNCIRKLRENKYEIGIVNANTPVLKANLLFRAINISRKVGMQFSRRENLDSLNDEVHFVDAHLRAIEGFILPVHKQNPKLYASVGMKESLQEKFPIYPDLGKPVIGICVGRADITYKDRIKRKNPVYTRGWGDLGEHIQNMSELITRCAESGWSVILIGGKNEKQIVDEIQKKLPRDCKITDMVGRTSMGESIALVSFCDVVVGVDTGMQHVSDAVGIYTVSIFGPTNPRTHGAYSNRAKFVETDVPCKYCYGTALYANCENRVCMKNIEVDQVFRMVKASLNDTGKNTGIAV